MMTLIDKYPIGLFEVAADIIQSEELLHVYSLMGFKIEEIERV